MIKVILSLGLYPLRKLPFSSEKFGPPKGYYRLMTDWERSLSGKDGEGFRIVAAPERLDRKAPRTIERKTHWIFRREHQRTSPEAVVASLRNGRVWVSHNDLRHVVSSAHITEDDRIIGPLSDEFGCEPDQHSIFNQIKLPRVHNVSGRAISLVTTKGEQFYHWMYDMLPKLASLERAGIDWREQADHIIVNDQSSRFMKETLDILGFPAEKLVDTQTYPHIKADEMIIPSIPASMGNPTVWISQFLRNSFLPHRAPLPHATSKRVYISRAKAQFRNVINEAEVIEVLKHFGFQVFILENMSYCEQVALFAQAEVIVAPHGAGLSGLVYCNPGTTVVEFFSPQYVYACFYALADNQCLDYHYLLGEGKSPEEGVNLLFAHADITLSIQKLTKALEFANVKTLKQRLV